MAVKQTIAIVGNKNKYCMEMMQYLVNEGYPLLYILCEEDESATFIQQIMLDHQNADIEILKCPKEACWEADIVMVFNQNQIGSTNFIHQILDFTTQKILAAIVTDSDIWQKEEGFRTELQNHLPHTHIVSVYVEGNENGEIQIQGQDEEALGVIAEIFKNLENKIQI